MPEEKGYDAFMSITDHFSKRIALAPGRPDYTAEDWAGVYYYATLEWGILSITISDRDRKWTSDFWKGVFQRQGTKQLLTTAYHPQADGQSERSNQTVELALRFHIGQNNLTPWPDVLPEIAARMNNHPNATTGKSPNEILFGMRLNDGGIDRLADQVLREQIDVNLQPIADGPTLSDDHNQSNNSLPLTTLERNRAIARAEAADCIAYAIARMKLRYDNHH